MNKKPLFAMVFLLAATAIGVAAVSAAVPPVHKPETEAELLSAFSSLKDHLQGRKKLDAKRIETQKLTIDKHRELFGYNDATIKAALDLVATYDKVEGPLWVARSGFNRKGTPPVNDIHWTIYTVMQNIMDRVYTAENVARHADLLNGFKFGSSTHFPGAVDPPARPGESCTVKINGSYPKTWGWATMHDGPGTFARKPTGTYLAPGTMATVTVPPSLVGKGYKIRVGSHSWDLSKKPRVLRLDRSSLVYDITSPETKVAGPLGGGIYIEVPYQADAGVVEVTIRNAVRSPYFSMKPFHTTSLEEWKTVERNRQAPWADFQTEKFMMQVPTSWIRKLDDPVTLMQNWDTAMDTINDLMGFPRLRGKETMYPQVDVILRSGAYAPGYPSVNVKYDPTKDYGGYAPHHLVRGPQHANYYEFHEQGHGYLFPKFPGEVESEVNLLHVAVWNQKFGYSLDEAFRMSSGGYNRAYCTLDTTAMAWMTCSNFVKGNPMEGLEKQYQLKGHAKFVDIARLFGWGALSNYWYSFTSDYENSAARPTDVDSLLLRLSKNVGVDIRPLFHFWGVPPVNTTTLATAIAAANLHASPAIYDTLVHYKSLVPTNNAAFQAFAFNWWGKQPSTNGHSEEREHAAQWEEFNEETAARIKKTVQEIIDTYFPDGRPPAAKKSVKEMQEDFLKLKFGMFIHFNLATYKDVEWVSGYHSPADFNPGGTINTDAWADAAVSAGMKYAILTAKHVGGFCLWDSKYTTYDVMHPDCPYKQDLVAQFIKSFKSRGLKVGLYYCWRHPGFKGEFKVLPPECDPATHTKEEQIEFQKKQIAELIEKYPDVFYIWNDSLDPKIMPAEEALAHVRSIRPDVIASANWWDWGKKGTPYLDIAVKELRHFPEGNTAPGETCWCLEQKWFRHEGARPKTAKQVVGLITTANGRNSNFLLNVGPDRHGKFEESSVKVLAEIGKLLNPNATADPPR